MRAFVALFILTACGASPNTEDRTVTDLQAACVDGDTVRVQFMACLSSSCDTLQSATCEARASGGQVEVTGAAIIRREGLECTSDCGLVTADCPLPDGVDPAEDILVFGGDDGGPVIEDATCDGFPG